MTEEFDNVGIVDYGLAEPYAGAFPGARREPPAELNRLAENNELDYALTSSAKLLELDWEVFSRCGIGSGGPVKTAILVSDSPLEAVETLRLDPDSRTTNLLARVILNDVKKLGGVELETRENGEDLLTAESDAAVVIGDDAFAIEQGDNVFDLASLWKNLTRTDFVFALWGVREPNGGETEFVDTVSNTVVQARERGFDKEIEELIRRTGVDREEAGDYLNKNIDYQLQDSHLSGLKLFVRKASLLDGVELNEPEFFA